MKGRVFHVTPLENLASIRRDNGLRPNTKLDIKSLFGNTETGFFRQKNCVSFFDYRDYGSNKWKEFVNKCKPTQILDSTTGIAVFFLSNKQLDNLIPWTTWKDEEAYSQRVVPYIEIGHKGFVPMKMITKVIIFERKTESRVAFESKNVERA
ncbi:hypothetical protein [Photobacterium damselae]|uniref:hypothetical protein n=1 Tax=Photobacterium damselae TaxID=38293 RepID=UPI004067626E